MIKFAIFEEIQGEPIDSESSYQIGSNRYFHQQIWLWLEATALCLLQSRQIGSRLILTSIRLLKQQRPVSQNGPNF